MESSVTTVAKMAFKKVKTNTGDSMKLIQRCDPTTREYTNVTFDERWNEDTEPPAEIIKECPEASGTDARVAKSALVTVAKSALDTSAGMSSSIHIGTLAVGVVGLVLGAGMVQN